MHRDAQQIPDLRFNLSHSGELMLVAVTAAREVGVDVELARDRYPAEFLREWTMREATRSGSGPGARARSLFAPARGRRAIRAPGCGRPSWTSVPCGCDRGGAGRRGVRVAVARLEPGDRGSGGAVLERQLSGELAQARGGGVALGDDQLGGGSGHSIAMSGSSQAMPRSTAGS